MNVTKVPPGAARGSGPVLRRSGGLKAAKNNYNRLWRPAGTSRVRPGGIPKGVTFAQEAQS
jgi:hypothetical protein